MFVLDFNTAKNNASFIPKLHIFPWSKFLKHI